MEDSKREMLLQFTGQVVGSYANYDRQISPHPLWRHLPTYD